MDQILIGYDGSTGAHQGISLVAGLPWAPATVVRVVTAVPDAEEIRSAWGGVVLADPADLEREMADQASAALRPAADRLAAAGLRTESALVKGRAPQALAEEARRVGADLVVVGSRGRGPLASTLLGSVSAEVVDISPCPVLVARTEGVRRIVFATDGSETAERAERFLATLPAAKAVPVVVVSAAEVLRPWTIGIAPTMYRQAMEAQVEVEAELREEHARIASASVARLAGEGIDAVTDVRIGDPATEVLASAVAAGADLIVLGSRGRTGIRRLVLGSVARRVLQRASASVCIVHAVPEAGAGS